MCSVRERATENSSFTFGLIQLQISTPIPSSGILRESCELIPFSLLDEYIYIYIYICREKDKVSLTDHISCFISRFSVDGTPIREFKNSESVGVSYPKKQPMRIYSSLWNADDWATRGGLVKTDWSQAPFTASYRNFSANACVWSSSSSSCSSNNSSATPNPWLNEELDATSQERLKWVQKNYMIYNYCADTKRFPQGFPPECVINTTSWWTQRDDIHFIDSNAGQIYNFISICTSAFSSTLYDSLIFLSLFLCISSQYVCHHFSKLSASGKFWNF